MDVVVFASAGAEEVVLDTVVAADSVRVDVRVRADTLILRAVRLPSGDAQGRELSRRVVELTGDSAVRWEIGRAVQGRESPQRP